MTTSATYSRDSSSLSEKHFLCSERHTSFTGKERDEETGYGYFGARYMDHELMTMWLSVDPMVDKYPGISPYAYCAWNPVRLVDPDGRDVWEVDNKGNVTRKSDEGGSSKQTVNYANGYSKSFRGSKYHQIMSDLSKREHNDVSSSYGNSHMQSAYANVFKTMADNTDVEWIMERYSDNHYALGTKHLEDYSPSSDILTQGRQTSDNVLATIHSHPMPNWGTDPATKDAQISSMGYLYSKGVFNGDALLKQRSLQNACYYTYFPKTQQLWSVGRYRPAFIKNIYSFSDFFFGTYNSK